MEDLELQIRGYEMITENFEKVIKEINEEIEKVCNEIKKEKTD